MTAAFINPEIFTTESLNDKSPKEILAEAQKLDEQYKAIVPTEANLKYRMDFNFKIIEVIFFGLSKLHRI